MELETKIYLALGDDEGDEIESIIHYSYTAATHDGDGRPVPAERSIDNVFIHANTGEVDLYPVIRDNKIIMKTLNSAISEKEASDLDSSFSPLP